MTNPAGFLEIERRERLCRPVGERVKDWLEIALPLPSGEVARQAERCMDCGIPFCHTGCPVDNLIPDWNDLVSRDQWRAALDRLHLTNNFPEFTGRVCPAPCEAACTLNIDDDPVTIKTIECEIVDRGWREGWIVPEMTPRGTGRRVAIVFEKSDRIGGLLRYGIPDFKMDRMLIDRRIAQMEREGVIFRTGMEIGVQVPVERLMDDYCVLVLAAGAESPRGLTVPGRELGGIHYAMDYLVQQNRRNAGLGEPEHPILATGKKVVVIGGGDTGSDCIGTAHRQGAASVAQLEILPEPPLGEDKGLIWPHWPMKLRTSSSQEEGATRGFSIVTSRFEGENGRVTRLAGTRDGQPFALDADLVLLAMGFTGSPPDGILKFAGVELPSAGYATSRANIFACGDMRRGQSLVVWAIREGRECAASVDAWLAVNR